MFSHRIEYTVKNHLFNGKIHSSLNIHSILPAKIYMTSSQPCYTWHPGSQVIHGIMAAMLYITSSQLSYTWHHGSHVIYMISWQSSYTCQHMTVKRTDKQYINFIDICPLQDPVFFFNWLNSMFPTGEIKTDNTLICWEKAYK